MESNFVMGFDCNDFLKLSKALLADSNYCDNTFSEAAMRTIISRAYYAAFLYARQQLEQKHRVRFNKKARVHKQVMIKLKTYDRTLGGLLHTLRENRNKADYNVMLEINKSHADFAVKLAEQLVKSPIN